MKIKIRKGLFETNSSSIHTLAVPISRSNKLERFPDEVRLNRDSFGWGFETLYDFHEKCNYIYTLCIDKDWGQKRLVLEEKNTDGWKDTIIIGYDDDSYTARFVDYIKSKGAEVQYYFGGIWDGGIDHSECWESDNMETFLDWDFLDRLLLDPDACIVLANDNDDYSSYMIPLRLTESKYDLYYKGN